MNKEQTITTDEERKKTIKRIAECSMFYSDACDRTECEDCCFLGECMAITEAYKGAK